MIAPARAAALQVLQGVGANRSDLPAAIARARDRLDDPRDRALLVELATGTLRWRGAIDHLIAHASKRPLHRLDEQILDILRLGIYQLLHLTRVPAAAVVDDAVQMTRKARKASAAGFVNAVLRHVSRTRGHLPLPPRPTIAGDGTPADRDAALDYLFITLSHPRWLIARWMDAHGFEAAERWARFNNEPAPLALRVNTLRVTRGSVQDALRRHGVECRETTVAPDGLVIVEGNPLLTPLAGEGLFMLQDEASQAVACLSLAAAGERVFDTCAAPGGKSLAIAAGVGPDGLVVAGDVRGRRIDLLRDTLARARATRVFLLQIDLNEPLPVGPVFDCVFVDAPCSGLGTIRRDPEIRWRRRPEDLPSLAAAQLRMLQHAAAAVRLGGRLVYTTCSSEPEENEAVVAAFLSGDARFTPLDRAAILNGLPSSMRGLINDAGHLRSWPWRHGLEAFFGAVLVRRMDELQPSHETPRSLAEAPRSARLCRASAAWPSLHPVVHSRVAWP
jgi:16S rRNA (cytosine967-C5)-methyltransferase